MGRSQRPRLRELRDLHLLIVECCELGADPRAWRRHMLTRLVDVVFGQAGAALEMEGVDSAGRPNRGSVVDVGWPLVGDRAAFLRLRRDWATGLDPFFAACMDLVRQEDRLITHVRRDLVGDQQWYDSPILNVHFAEAGLDDILGSYCPLGDGSCHVILINRRACDPPFELRHRRLLHLLHHEISRHFHTRLRMLGTGSADALSRRMREVLAQLCLGDSEKQVAMKLGISPHTVHTYIKRLHKHFDVASRGELLARTRGMALGAGDEEEPEAPGPVDGSEGLGRPD